MSREDKDLCCDMLIELGKQLQAKVKMLNNELMNSKQYAGGLENAQGFLDRKMANLEAKVKVLDEENKELRARLHKIGDDRLEESVKHCTLQSENRESKEQIQQLQARIAELEAENKQLKRWPDYFAWEREMEKREARIAELEGELKHSQWFIATLRDVFAYNEYNIIDLVLIEKCLSMYEDCECFTKEDYGKIHLELLESGLALLPTTDKAIKACESEVRMKEKIKNFLKTVKILYKSPCRCQPIYASCVHESLGKACKLIVLLQAENEKLREAINRLEPVEKTGESK